MMRRPVKKSFENQTVWTLLERLSRYQYSELSLVVVHCVFLKRTGL